MFTFIIYLFLIFQSQNLVFSNNVLDWAEAGSGDQLSFPWYRKTTAIETRNLQIKVSSGETYLVVCGLYNNEEPKADIFTNKGILIESLILKNIGGETCAASNIKQYISPRGPKRKGTPIIYLMSDKICVERTYSVKLLPLMGVVDRSRYTKVDCPDEVDQFLKSNPEWQGGVVYMADHGKGQDFDYTDSLYVTVGSPKVLRFETKDPEEKVFKLMCEEFKLKSPQPAGDQAAREERFTTGSIMHQDNYAVTLDRFKMTSCDKENINVNRQIVKNKNSFKVVFKTTKGLCYERRYKSSTVSVKHYFDKTTITRMKPKKVTCPASFVGDINMNAYQPWYSRVINNIFQRQVKPFSVKKE